MTWVRKSNYSWNCPFRLIYLPVQQNDIPKFDPWPCHPLTYRKSLSLHEKHKHHYWYRHLDAYVPEPYESKCHPLLEETLLEEEKRKNIFLLQKREIKANSLRRTKYIFPKCDIVRKKIYSVEKVFVLWIKLNSEKLSRFQARPLVLLSGTPQRSSFSASLLHAFPLVSLAWSSLVGKRDLVRACKFLFSQLFISLSFVGWQNCEFRSFRYSTFLRYTHVSNL